jgi:hypothetical protein
MFRQDPSPIHRNDTPVVGSGDRGHVIEPRDALGVRDSENARYSHAFRFHDFSCNSPIPILITYFIKIAN